MMKKFLLALACALPLLGLSSCSNDEKDLPNVDITLQVSGAAVSDNQIYVVSDSTLTVDAIVVTNNDQGKAAGITYANYFLDNRFIGRSVVAPFGATIPMPADMVPVGNHMLTITCPVYAVDKEVAFASLSYPLIVVSSEDEMPESGTTTHTTTPHLSETDTSL